MANAAAFDQGYAIGQGRAQEQRAIKQGHAETAWEDQHNDLREAIKNTQQKLWNLDKSSPSYQQDHAQGLQDLTSSIQAYQDFVHPQKNPGAWEKVRHLVGMDGKPHPLAAPERISSETTPGVEASTVDLGSGPVTMPATPAFKTATAGPTPTPDESSSKALYPSQVKDRAKRLQQSQAEAGRMEAGGPETDEAKSNRELQTKYAQIDKSPLSPEDKAEAKRKLWGIYARPSLQKYQLADGTVQFFDAGRPDLIPEGASAYVKPDAFSQLKADYDADPRPPSEKGTLEEYKAKVTQRPSTAAFNQYMAAYAKDHGTTVDKLPQAAMDYLRQKWSIDAANAMSTETNTLKEDFKGDWRPVTEINTRTPSAKGNLVDPLGSDSGRGSSGGGASGGGQTPRQVRDQASARSGGGSTSPNSRVRVGNPVFAGKNKEYDDAQTAYDGAVKRANKMHDNLKEAMKSPPDQQAMLSLVANHIGMTLGAQKGARINQAVWNEAVESTPWLAKTEARFDPNSGILSGVALAPEQMKQMVGLADESVKAEKESLDDITNRLEKSSGAPQSGGSTAKHKIKIGSKQYTYKGTGDTADLKNYDEVKQ